MSLCKAIFQRIRHYLLSTMCLLIVFSLSLFGCSTQPNSNPISAVETIEPSPVQTIKAAPKQTPGALENTSSTNQNTLFTSEVSNYQEAIIALNHQDTHKALIIFEELQATQPWFIGAWINGSKALVDQGHWSGALAALNQAEGISPELPAIYTLQAYCHRQRGDFHKAQSAYKKALSMQPNYALAHYNYGILLDLYLQKPEQALLHYERYQTLQNKPDKQVQGWIKELKRRVKEIPSKP